MIFIIGTGKVFAETPPTYLYNGKLIHALALQQQEKLLKLFETLDGNSIIV
jgi:hypothetical protein